MIKPLWKLLKSMKFAVWMIIVLAVISLLSMFLVEFYPIDTHIQNWEEVYQESYGYFFPVMKALHLHDPYRAWWYQSLLAVLTLSLTLCIIDNAPKKIKSAFRLRFIADPEELKRLKFSAQIIADEKFPDHIASAFRGYTVRTKTDGDKLLISANRSQFGCLGSVMTHVGLLLLVIGGFIAIWGVSTYGSGFPGDVIRDENLGFQVRIDDFRIEYYPLGIGQWVLVDGNNIGKIMKKLPDDKFRVRFFARDESFSRDIEAERIENRFDIESDRGNISDYITVLTVIDQGEEIMTRPIEVNKPLRYKGFSFYQSSFDSRNPRVSASIDSALVEISLIGNGAILDSVYLSPEAEYPLPYGARMILADFVPDFRISEGEIISASEHMHNPAVEIKVFRDNEEMYHQWCFPHREFHHTSPQAEYSFRALNLLNPRAESEYRTILEIKENHGYAVIWAGLICAAIGVVLSFYFIPRQIWAIVSRGDAGVEVQIAGYSPKAGPMFSEGFNRIVERIKMKG